MIPTFEEYLFAKMFSSPLTDEEKQTAIEQRINLTHKDYVQCAIEFAKLHCEQQAQTIVKNHYLMIDGISEKANGQRYYVEEGNHYTETEIEVDKESILNAYDLNEIK